MEKLQMKSVDAVEGNVAKIAALFPHCVTERLNRDGKPELAIDFDKLRAELSTDAIDTGEERYQFTWPDKRAASRLANTPTDKTLRPDVDASVDFWNTKNLYIEGDNLEVLKVLRENYLGKVKMIYIDPPYNTGKDSVYRDKYSKSIEDFERENETYDEDGNIILDPMQRNTASNGRFHTDWLNLIYPRLKVAKDLLKSGGVIFISIDDNELDNLKKVSDEVFGAQNFIDIFCWAKTETPENLSIKSRQVVEYILCYQKDKDSSRFKGLQKYSSSSNGLLNQPNAVGILKFPASKVITKIPNGTIKAGMHSSKKYDVELLDDVEIKDGLFVNEFRLKAKFKWQLSYLDNELANGTVISIPTMNFSPAYDKTEYAPEVPTNFINSKVGVDTNENAGEYQLTLFPTKVFNFPKPVSLVKYLLGFTDDAEEEFIVLDFFSGSATTAEAVMEMNIGRKKSIKYIMVQLQEDLYKTLSTTTEQSQKEIISNAIEFCETNKVPANICEVAKERIRRAGKKILEEMRRDVPLARSKSEGDLFDGGNSTCQRHVPTLDIGFRVLKLDSSNMEDVFYAPKDFNEADLFNDVDNVKLDRTPLDLLFQVMPELDIELSAKIEEKEVNGKKVFFVDDTYLIATFDTEVNESTVTEIAKMRPQYFVMRDASAANDNVLDNFEQIFRHYSPDTIRKIL